MLPRMAATMLDIAKDLNVSVVTVSKVLGNKGNISAATRAKVLQKAKELNYQKNWIASSLVTRRTFTIGLLLPDFTHPFFGEIAKAIAESVRSQGYHVIISYFEEDPALERTEVESLLARQVDGLILASSQSPQEADLFHSIQKRKVPFVLIDRPVEQVRTSFVGCDDLAIGRLATEHLVQQGCRRVAHLRGPGDGIAERRAEGYRSVLAKNKLPSHQVIEAGYDDHTGYEAMRKLLRSNSLPDGVFCYNDPVAIGAMQAILEAGLQIPKNIAVVGAGNVYFSNLLAVPLSTVDQGTQQIGTRAAELLLEQINSKRAVRPRRVLIFPKLVVRQSSQRII